MNVSQKNGSEMEREKKSNRRAPLNVLSTFMRSVLHPLLGGEPYELQWTL